MRAVLLRFLATAALVSATSLCAKDNVEDLVSKTSCGCPKKLSKCLGIVDLERSDQIEQCLIASGCEEADAVGGAIWFARKCQKEDSEAQGELRKRKTTAESTVESTAETTAEDKTTSAGKTATEDQTSTKKDETTAKTTVPSSAAASTTAAVASTSTADSTTVSTPSSTQSDSTTVSNKAASETTGKTTSSLQCSVTKMVTTSVCSSTKGGSKTCTPTITPTATCAPGVICQTDSAGNDVCLLKINKLTTSGTVVTIVFAVGIIASAIGIIIVQYKSRRAVRQREMERMALLGGGSLPRNGKGRAPDVESTQTYGQTNPSEAHIPLMEPGGARSDQQNYQQQYNSDPGRAAPKLHPGLGALGNNVGSLS